MSDHVYKVVELVGTSETGIEDAVQTAIARASRTLKHIRWFEIVSTRGHVEDSRIAHYQVTIRVGFTIEDSLEASSANDDIAIAMPAQ